MKVSLEHLAYRFLLLLAWLLLPSSNYAQSISLKLYNINDGLPSNFAYRTYQDKSGYLWIATSAGISRFDGRQFVNYTLSDGLLSLKGDGFLEDSKNRLWVGMNGGIQEFKNNRFIAYATDDNQNIGAVGNFLETRNKKIWAITDKGVYEFADTIWKKISLYPGFKNIGCKDIIEADNGLYCNYRQQIVFRNKAGCWMTIASVQDEADRFDFMCLHKGEIWASNNKNLYVIRNGRQVPVFKKDINNYFTFHFDSKNRLWLAGENFVKVSKPGDWAHFPDSVYDEGYHFLISEDKDHNIWTGKVDGLLKIKYTPLTVIDKIGRTPLLGVNYIVPLPDDKILLSSLTNVGMQVFGNDHFTPVYPKDGAGINKYAGEAVSNYAYDDKNNLWLVLGFKYFLYYGSNGLQDFTAALHLKKNSAIYDMAYIKTRNRFFICGDSTLIYGYPLKFSTFIPRNTGKPIYKPVLVRGLKNGLIILYIEGRGVFAIDNADTYVSLIKQTGIDGRKKGINLDIHFYEGADNTVWIAFPGLGLYQYGFSKNQSLFLKNHLTVANGLQSNKIICMAGDLRNRLWLSTYGGIDLLQKNKSGGWDVFNYAKSEDLSIVQVDNEKMICDASGNIWLSSPEKIIKFNPSEIRLSKKTPDLIIEKISVDFKETDWSKLTDSLYSYFQLPCNPVLSYDQNSLGIFFNAIDFSVSNSTPEYSYKLLPLDTSWSIPSKTKSVSFAQLPSGKYQFIVRAKKNASGWSQPAVFRFTITPPFWDRWWFRIIILAFAAFIIICIFKARIKKIRSDAFIQNQLRELEMKALKAQMNPHFIYNALNSIQALVANDKKAEGIHYIGSFSRLLRQVLDNSENSVISLDKELETIGLYIQLESLRLDMQLHYKKNIPDNIVTEFEKIPPLILQPFVENALWHGLSRKEGEKEIKIKVSLNADWLICDITDNGIGREKAEELKNISAAIRQSKGIDITRKRLIDFNEDESVSPIEFIDLFDNKKKPAGTQVTVLIKRKFNLP